MMMWGAIVAIAVVAIVVFMVIGIYNSLVRLRNAFKNNFAQIDVQLKRRYDLIPNLVETAKKFMAHEKETLEAVIQARNHAFQAGQAAAANPTDSRAVGALGQAETQLTQSMGKLMAVFESYPDIKADSTMNGLMEELTSTENKIAFARQAYNDSVMTYNNGREQFPNNVFAGMFNFQQAQLLEIENPVEREAVKVQF
jgi:LemA protein